MYAETAIGAALKKRPQTLNDLLVALIWQRLGGDGAERRADTFKALRAEVRADPDLLAGLIGEEEITRRLRALVDACAKDMKGSSSGGHNSSANDGRGSIAPARRPNGDEAGHPARALDEGLPALAPSSPPESEAVGGQKPTVSPEAVSTVPPAASGPHARQAARREVRQAAAKALMETTFVRGRGTWANIALGELRAIAVEDTRNALIARRLLNYVTPGMSMAATVRDVFSMSVFDQAFAEGDDAARGVLADVA